MNTIRKWLDGSKARKQVAEAQEQAQWSQLTARLEILISALRTRLSAKFYEFIADLPGYAEAELAIHVLWEEVERAGMVLSPGEREELLALTNHPKVRGGSLSTGKKYRAA